MSLLNAIEAGEIKPGSQFKIGKEIFTVDSEGKIEDTGKLKITDFLNPDFEIIEAAVNPEPVFFTAEETLCHMDDFDKTHEPDIIKYGEIMEMQGMVKRDNDYVPVMEWVCKHLETNIVPDLAGAIQNLNQST